MENGGQRRVVDSPEGRLRAGSSMAGANCAAVGIHPRANAAVRRRNYPDLSPIAEFRIIRSKAEHISLIHDYLACSANGAPLFTRRLVGRVGLEIGEEQNLSVF